MQNPEVPKRPTKPKKVPKAGRVYIRCQPEDEAAIKKMAYEYLYNKDEQKKLIYDALVEQGATTTLQKIANQLRRDFDIKIRASTLAEMAQNCGLTYLP